MEKQKNICVLGSGAWGSVLASLLADNGNEVTIYGVVREEIDEINTRHTNEKYLKNFKINDKINATLHFENAVENAEIIVFAVPSFAIKDTAKKVCNYLKNDTVIVNVAKGFDKETGKTLGETLRENLPKNMREKVVSLIGPSFAEEVAEKQFTAITASAENEEFAKQVQRVFSNDYFRVYTNKDTVGTELCSSLKNVIALASGILDGIGCKVNTRSALITRGMAEIKRFVLHFNGKEETCFSLAGIGDLILTCSSKTSRNYTAGYTIGANSLEYFKATNTKTVEGIFATEIAYEIAKKENIYSPIISAIYNVIFNGTDPRKEIEFLMKSTLKGE